MSEPFKISGFDGAVRALRQLPQEIAGKVLATALRESGTPMAEDAARSAPRGDRPSSAGHMADSIRLRAFTDQASNNDVEANVWIGPDRGHFYGSFSEWGSRFEDARPFMRPAFDRHKHEVIDLLGKELWKGIARAAKRLAPNSGSGGGGGTDTRQRDPQTGRFI